ncbi:hypothetical protein LG299_08670 [Microbacterium lacus]|uniref:hypothetical protein n=1 Tax=Microbacterium lacus TaxID=415217 RepID=UPI00384A4E59
MTSIDRRALVARHDVRLDRVVPASPLSVGNGEFNVTVDATGLQTFPDAHPVAERYGGRSGTLLGTMSHWGWHSLPGFYDAADFLHTYESPHGQALYQDLGGTFSAESSAGQSIAEEWLRNNPHRLDLGRIALDVAPGVTADDLTNVSQHLDLWAGTIHSSFSLGGSDHRVTTAVHPERDAVAFRIAGANLGVRLSFPYGSEDWGNGADWTHPGAHTSALTPAEDGWTITRTLDATVYTVQITAPGSTVVQIGPHEFAVRPRAGAATHDVTVEFTPEILRPEGRAASAVFSAAATHWEAFWLAGGAVDLASSDDPRAGELERRVVLSQYVSALTAGSLPPAETGLMLNSWRGKFHLEMHWWHHAWLPQWGRSALLEPSLSWYERVLPRARETAARQGLTGARWPKQVGPEGVEAPSPIGPFLVWQQPHPIHLAELMFRAHPDASTVRRWAPIVFASADFMAAFASNSSGGFELGPPIIPAQESYVDGRATARNPTFELAYWAWGLQTAIDWKTRLGEEVPARWVTVARGMTSLPVRDGLYPALATPPYLVRDDHPSMLATLGVVPRTHLVDDAVMSATLRDVLRDWDWDSAWGWDFPMAAMTAARLGDSALAVDCLLMDRPKNTYLANGHNRQNESLPIYLPGNGGLLTAVGLLAAGSDDSGTARFGAGWHPLVEGVHPAP